VIANSKNTNLLISSLRSQNIESEIIAGMEASRSNATVGYSISLKKQKIGDNCNTLSTRS
jgi:hypothetical protein